MEYQEHKVSGLLSSYVDSTRSSLVGKAVRPGMKMLDIGCGNGLLIPYLPKDVEYTGVDINPDILQWLAQRYPKFQFFPCRVGTDPLPQATFDVITLAGFIEHIEPSQYKGLMQEVRKSIKPDGCIVLTTPTPIGGQIHKAMAMLGLVSKEAADEHKGFLSKSMLAQLFKETGFEVVEHSYYFLGMAHYVIAKPV